MRSRRAVTRLSGTVVRLGLVALAAVSLAGCGLLPSEPVSIAKLSLKIPPSAPPATVPVERGTVASTVQIAGQVTSQRSSQLYFRSSGRIATLRVADGQIVRPGEVLATLDSGDLAIQIALAKVSVEQDQLNVTSAHLQAESSAPTTAIAAQQQAVQLQQATLALHQDESGLAALRRQMAADTIVAPFAGEVDGIANHVGDQVTAFAPLMEVYDPKRPALIAMVDGQTVTELHRGERLTIRLTGPPVRRIVGVITHLYNPTEAQILQAETSTNGNVVPSPTVTIVPVAGALPPLGQTFSALIVLHQVRNVVFVPSDVVRSLSGGSYVDVYAHGVVSQVQVTTGLEGDTTTAVLSGLSPGQRVVQP